MIVYTASDIADANYCMMRLWLKKIKGEKSKRLSVYEKGSLLHDIIKKFWDRLGTSEEAPKKRGEKRYSNAEEFADYVQRKWMQRVIGARESKNPILWRFEDEEWVIKHNLLGISHALFDILCEEGKPEFSELKFRFLIGNREFRGRIDDVRKRNGKVVIRDYKSGNPWMKDIKINNDPQLTLYNVGLCSCCYSNEGIARRLGLEDEVKRFMGHPFYINPNFELEYFMVEAPYYREQLKRKEWKRSPEIILPTKRREEHFFELLKMVDGIKKTIDTGEIYPERGDKCGNCDVNDSCEKELDKVGKGSEIDGKGQFFLSFALPVYIKKEEDEKQKTIKKSGQKTFRFKS